MQSNLILLLYFLLALKFAFPQTVFNAKYYGISSAKKEDGRIILQSENNTSIDKDEISLIESFDIRIQWWSLLGEPIEKYDFTWYAKDQFIIDNATIEVDRIKKFPSLYKRFMNIEPLKVWVFLEGNDAEVIGNWSPTFLYLIDHLKILPSKNGKKGDGIVAGSPHWNEFLDWGEANFNNFLSRKTYSKGNKTDKSLTDFNKKKFKEMKFVSIKSRVQDVEWNLNEIRAIVDLLEKYEKGEKKEEAADDLNDLLSGSGQNDDLNDLLSQDAGRNVKYDIDHKNGKQGVVAEDGRILIPYRNWQIQSYDPITGFAVIKHIVDEFKDSKLFGEEKKTTHRHADIQVEIYDIETVDEIGNTVIPKKRFATVSDVSQVHLYLTMGSNKKPDKNTQLAIDRKKQEENENTRKKDLWVKNQIDYHKKKLRSQNIIVN